MIVEPLFAEEDDVPTWMRQPVAVQELHAEIGGATRLRVESPEGRLVFISAPRYETVDGTLPPSWAGSPALDDWIVFGPAAFQEPGFWARYVEGDDEAQRTYTVLRTPEPESSTK